MTNRTTRVWATSGVMVVATAVVVTGLTIAPGCKGKSSAATGANPAAAKAVTARYRAALEALGKRVNFTDIASVDLQTSPPKIDATLSRATWAGVSASLASAQGELAELGRIAREPAASEVRTIVDDPMTALGAWRNIARALRADAIRAGMAKDASTATERLATLVLVVRHLSQDPELVTTLVGAAVLSLACEAINEVQTGPHAISLTPDQKKTILAALDCLDSEDPAGVDSSRSSDAAVDSKSIDSVVKQTRDAVKSARQALR